MGKAQSLSSEINSSDEQMRGRGSDEEIEEIQTGVELQIAWRPYQNHLLEL